MRVMLSFSCLSLLYFVKLVITLQRTCILPMLSIVNSHFVDNFEVKSVLILYTRVASMSQKQLLLTSAGLYVCR